MIFGGKDGEQALAKAMKEKFKLVKKPHGYAIYNIYDPVLKVVTQILAWKVMRKCCVNEVSVPIVALAIQCAKGV